MMIARLGLFLVWALPSLLAAQGPSTSEGAKARAALAPFRNLVGKWEGDARVSLMPGQPQVVRQYEEITLDAGGTILRVKGVGRSTEAATKGNVVFEATATVWFDSDMNKLRMRAHTTGADTVEADIEVRPDTLIWGFPMQGGRIRFTVAYTNTDWHEVGHFIPNGAAPIPTVETRLKKIK